MDNKNWTLSIYICTSISPCSHENAYIISLKEQKIIYSIFPICMCTTLTLNSSLVLARNTASKNSVYKSNETGNLVLHDPTLDMRSNDLGDSCLTWHGI